MRMGRLEDAEALSVRAQELFPTDFGVLRSRADGATRRRDWPEALRRWKEFQTFYPNADEVSVGLNALRNAMQLEDVEQGDGDAPPELFVIEEVREQSSSEGAVVASPVAVKVHCSAPLQRPELFNHFESLGETCELGVVQRIGGAHAVGLLRWCSINTKQLIAALESRFEGVGTLEHTYLTVDEHGEYILNDRRYFLKHTFTFVDDKQTDADKLLRRLCHWLVLLREKLIADLESAEKIFVYKPADGAVFEVAEVMHIWRGVRRYAANTVLYVRLQSALHPAGTVEKIADGLLFGYIDRDPTSWDLDGVGYDCWSQVCRAAAELAVLEKA
jgi:hypothetical protein